MTQSPNTKLRRFPVDRKLLAASMIVGATAGAMVGQRLKPTTVEQTTEPVPAQPMIDWERVRSIAISMNKGLALTAGERDRQTAAYRELEAKCLPIVSAYTGIELPDAVERTFAVDRVDWIEANITSFKRMFEPIEALNASSGSSTSAASKLFGNANRAVVSGEVGLLLAYLARHVLGQYDLSLLGRETVETGKLYYVEPNIRAVERALNLPQSDFRMWLALHETTHAFEFEGVPWLRSYFNGLIEQYFEFLKRDAEQLKQGFRAMRAMVGRAREQRGPEVSWLEAMMTVEQRALFNQMQAAMCMVEGYSNHVMNAVGRDLLPRFDAISKTFETRRRDRSRIDRLFVRLTGLELKYEQYQLGERFIDIIVASHGHDVAKRIWDNPASLPTMPEIRAPQLWISRVVDAKAP
ncbi:zinc-dependent metalloprotease [soil metagenome]